MANIEVVGLEDTGSGTGQLRSARPGTDTYTVTGSMSATASNATVTLSPTGTGTVAIQPAGTTTVGTSGQTTSMPGNISYTGTLTGGTGTVNLGSGQLVKDTSGNVGIGVVPSAWASGYTANQISTAASFHGATDNRAVMASNYVETSTGSKYIVSALASAYVQVNGTHFWYNAPSGTAGNAISFTETMRIDSSGNVGVGTSSPGAKLEVYGSGNIDAKINSGSYGYLLLGQYANGAYVGTSSSNSVYGVLRLGTGGSEYMRIDTSGNVGIGTTPTAALHLKAGTATASTAPLKFTSGTNLTTPEAGVVEYDGSAAYFTADTNAKRGLVPSYQFVRLASAYTTVSGSTALQQLFNTTAAGAVTVTAGAVYEFECVFGLSSLSSTSGSIGFGFNGGTATFTSVWYTASCNKGNNMQGTNGTAATLTTISASSTTTSANAIIKGILVINAGGTIVPSFSVSVAAAAVVGAGSFFKLTNVSNNASIGAWS